MDNRLKNHVEKNRRVYTGIVLSAVTASTITYVVMTKDTTVIKKSFNTKMILKGNTIKITNQLMPRDNPAYIIFDPILKRQWMSQNAFAKDIGAHPSMVSRYFNGARADVLGLKPIRLGHSMIPNSELLEALA